MKKTLAYAAAAILLGFVVIMLPKTIEPRLSTMGTTTNDSRNEFTPQASGQSLGTKPSQLISQPQNFLPSSLVLITGLITASAAYAILKKRIT